MSEHLASAGDRIMAIIDCVFRGGYHLDTPIHKKNVGTQYEYWEFSTHQELSTFDFDLLTRLVVAGHDQCVRVSIASSGPRMVKVILVPRYSREGGFPERHPRMEEAVEIVRRWETSSWAKDRMPSVKNSGGVS